jgi:biotin carboxyl carrier protein
MKVLVLIHGNLAELQLDRDASDWHFLYRPEGCPPIEGRASVVQVEPGVFSILRDGRSFEVRVVPGPEGAYSAVLNGIRSQIEIRDPRAFARKDRAGLGEGRQNVTAPMPGKVIRVLVSVGDLVEAGTGLVVVEAMKMQNEMKSPKAGRVVQLNVSDGTAVSAGEVLAVIE